MERAICASMFFHTRLLQASNFDIVKLSILMLFINMNVLLIKTENNEFVFISLMFDETLRLTGTTER